MIVGVNGRLLYQNTMEGVHRYVYETTVNMARMHPETTFIIYLDRPSKSTLHFPDNIVFRHIFVPTRHPFLWVIWFEFLLPFFLYFDKVDIFYSGDGFLSLMTRKPQVLVTHDLAFCHYPEHIPFFHRIYYQLFIKKFHQKAKAVIAVSKATKDDIIRQFGTEENKLLIGYNAINHDSLATSDAISPRVEKLIADGMPYFFSIGAIHPRKNIDRICESFRLFKNKYGTPHKLVIAGRFAWKSSRIQEEMERAPDVIFIGPITENEKYMLYKHATALLYLSLFEGFGIPILEAMFVGCPVITSSTSSMPEVAGNAALLANPLDVHAMSEAFHEISKPEVRERLIMDGYKREKEFSWDKTAKIIYSQLAKHVKIKAI